jgi:hypothetical protein
MTQFKNDKAKKYQLHLKNIPYDIFCSMRDECKRRGIQKNEYMTSALVNYLTISRRAAKKEAKSDAQK